MFMEWREDGYNYDNENNRVGYSGKPVRRSAGIGLLAKLVIVCALIYGGKSIFGTMPKKLAEEFDLLFQFLLGIFIFIVTIKIWSWFLQSRKNHRH